ncbi:MAG: glutamine--fructose-6-phosphate transaminase (isomerizing) [Gammaproteobacteria bacterium]|nr:glutamine--fructose-6-phosphate transaminase (isomerizing) [Gammaproteobacteria bacterium]
MCGIIGAIAKRNVSDILIEGLKRLEYRGYDSAGIAALSGNGISLQKVAGKVAGLEAAVAASPVTGEVGIGHTRWATHGVPNQVNAHPHMMHERIAVVHNGIIENYLVLKQSLMAEGYTFVSETDTEVACAVIDRAYQQTGDLLEALRVAAKQFEGAYAIAAIHKDHPNEMVAMRLTSPLLLGVGVGERYVASDMSALIPVTQQYIVLEPGDMLHLTADKHTIYDSNGQKIERPLQTSSLSADAVSMNGYTHYMQKEIHEQPVCARQTLQHLSNAGSGLRFDRPLAEDALDGIRYVHIVACGTSYYAAMVAKYWFESLADVVCQVEIASEFRYRDVRVPRNSLYLTISQSGETIDTLAALHMAKEQTWRTRLAICNVPESSIVRDADAAIMTQAGVEIGVASTKAYTTQLIALKLLVLALAERNDLDASTLENERAALGLLPELMEQCLALEPQIKSELVSEFAHRHHSIFLGRGTFYPIALEGALKLKEISYIHAEGYPAGELKHGPLALIDDDMPVVAVAPDDPMLDKLKANLEEVRSRGGQLIVFAENADKIELGEHDRKIQLPSAPTCIAPIVYVIALQLLSYHVALAKGTDVDRPRNLAKSVTVE